MLEKFAISACLILSFSHDSVLSTNVVHSGSWHHNTYTAGTHTTLGTLCPEQHTNEPHGGSLDNHWRCRWIGLSYVVIILIFFHKTGPKPNQTNFDLHIHLYMIYNSWQYYICIWNPLHTLHNQHHTLRPEEELSTARSILLRRGRYRHGGPRGAAGSAAHEAVEAVTACATARGSGARGRGAAGSAAAHEAVEDARTSSSSSSRLWIRERTKHMDWLSLSLGINVASRAYR